MKTYQFDGYFVTTDEDLSHLNPIAVWPVTEETALAIEQQGILEVNEDGALVVTADEDEPTLVDVVEPEVTE